MKKFTVFKFSEQHLLDTIVHFLEVANRSNDLELVKNNIDSLNNLAQAISRYPSVLEKINLGDKTRSINTLVDKLCNITNPTISLNLPTKAVLGKSYLIAKLNFFNMLNYIVPDNLVEGDVHVFLQDITKDIVFTLMAEDVLFEILVDKKSSPEIKEKVVHKLAELWEYRLDYGVRSFAPFLENIWAARGEVLPAYGTLAGTLELFQFAAKVDAKLLGFFDEINKSRSMQFALEEFLFGIMFEDLEFLRIKMHEMNRKALNKNEISKFLAERERGELIWDYSPKEFYEFFVTRINYARYRNRANTPGPAKSIEEYLMIYLLETSI